MTQVTRDRHIIGQGNTITSQNSLVSKLGPQLMVPPDEQEVQLMPTNPRNAFRGQSRSPNIVPFHMLGIVSSCAIETLSLRCAIFPIFDFQKCCDLEIWVRGH